MTLRLKILLSLLSLTLIFKSLCSLLVHVLLSRSMLCLVFTEFSRCCSAVDDPTSKLMSSGKQKLLKVASD